MPNSNWEQFGIQQANNIVSAGMGLALEGHNDRRQLRQQEKLQRLEISGQQQMTDYNMNKQYEMWLRTNYQAQMEQMKKAGLNPGLMYGMSGGGGVTTGQATGHVSGGEAPKGGGEIVNMMGMGIQQQQLQLLQAQKENIEADTANKQADTANKPIQGKNIEASTGAITQSVEESKTRIQSLSAGIENTKAETRIKEIQQRLLKLDEELKGKSLHDTLDRIKWEAKSAEHSMGMLENEVYIQGMTMNDRIATVNAELIGIGLRNAMTKQGTDNLQMEKKYGIIGGYYNRLREVSNSSERNSIERQKLAEDINKDTGIQLDIINDVIDAVILKQILSPAQPKRNPVGYK